MNGSAGVRGMLRRHGACGLRVTRGLLSQAASRSPSQQVSALQAPGAGYWAVLGGGGELGPPTVRRTLVGRVLLPAWGRLEVEAVALPDTTS